jgi:hypothetical protein
MENQLRFLCFFFLQKYMLGIRISVRFDPDIFKQIRILERTMAVRAMNI